MVTLADLNVRTGVKRKVTRDWICYHDPVAMGYPAAEADARSVQTAKRLRPDGLVGDRIWIVAKNARGDSFFVHGYFHVTSSSHRKRPGSQRAPLLIISGEKGLRFCKKVRVDDAAWFVRYKDEMQGLSHGLQRVKDAAVIKGLMSLLAEHRLRAV